jgi:hypothetical protein
LPVDLAETLAEVRQVERSLSELVSIPDDQEKERVVWSLYAKCERMVAVLKFNLDVEHPGRLLKLPRSEVPEEFLPLAMDALLKTDENLEGGRALDALESLRDARTNLRAYLASKHRIRMRSKRKRLPSAKPS